MLDSIPSETFIEVAQGVIGDSVFSVPKSTSWESIGAAHADLRTVAVVRYSSTAETQNGTKRWSSVVKVVDSAEEAGGYAHASRPESEIQIYENDYLTRPSVPFRPAKCYKIGNPLDSVKMIWLEDLTGAVQPPWGPDLYLKVANHLGSFNGHFATHPIELPFDVPVDIFAKKRALGALPDGLERLDKYRDSDEVRRAYANVDIELPWRFAELFREITDLVKGFDHCISFGDAHARNIFPLEHETVGIDWANVAYDPIGTDVGLLAGSALTQHPEEVAMAAANQRQIFDSYLEGLRSAGWHGNADQIRLASLAQMGAYLTYQMLLPSDLASGMLEGLREGYRIRAGVELEELPEKTIPVISLLPGIIDEIEELLG
jgi:hypothetical protein